MGALGYVVDEACEAVCCEQGVQRGTAAMGDDELIRDQDLLLGIAADDRDTVAAAPSGETPPADLLARRQEHLVLDDRTPSVFEQ
jgi:hypothetical protein